MPNASASRRAEAATFGAYLGSSQLPRAVVDRYELAVDGAPIDESDRFDAWLLRLAARHPVLTALGDTYARFARPYGMLRRRLTLMLALLETHGATHAVYTRARPSGPVVAWISLGASVVRWVLRSALAALICGPPHLLMGHSARPRG